MELGHARLRARCRHRSKPSRERLHHPRHRRGICGARRQPQSLLLVGTEAPQDLPRDGSPLAFPLPRPANVYPENRSKKFCGWRAASARRQKTAPTIGMLGPQVFRNMRLWRAHAPRTPSPARRSYRRLPEWRPALIASGAFAAPYAAENIPAASIQVMKSIR
jgi:hypothetical protein